MPTIVDCASELSPTGSCESPSPAGRTGGCCMDALRARMHRPFYGWTVFVPVSQGGIESSRGSDTAMPLCVPRWWESGHKQGINTRHTTPPLLRCAAKTPWLENGGCRHTVRRSAFGRCMCATHEAPSQSATACAGWSKVQRLVVRGHWHLYFTSRLP